MRQSIAVVDAFTNKPFAGNPAAVCIMEGPRSEEWMQLIAREMNLSETAFLHPEGDGYRLRWFTPAVEVALCGHATLASAHILFSQKKITTSSIRFHTLSGVLTATKADDKISLDFPAKKLEAASPPLGLYEALGAKGIYCGKNIYDYLVELESEAVLRELKPNFGELMKIDVRGIIVTTRSENKEFDCVSRFFGPRVGINEDPVTGSAHCAIGPYWAEKLGKTHINAYQASERGGEISISVLKDRVLLAGHAVTTWEGYLSANL